MEALDLKVLVGVLFPLAGPVYQKRDQLIPVVIQYGFRGIGAPHIKVMYELSAPDPAKCAPGLAKCAPSHK